jgi:hypothetical protein
MSKEIATNKIRMANFTSSNIYRLMGTPAVVRTYVEEKRFEQKLKRSLDTGEGSQATAWGTFLEMRVHGLLGLEYQIESNETRIHPFIDRWSGSADLIVKGVKVSDIKCYGLKKFCQYAECLETKDLDLIKKEFPKEYWQLVSNATINEVPNAEAILYLPYYSELPEIREMAQDYDGADQWKYRFITEKENYELSSMPDNSDYKNLNIFEFDVPQKDIDDLTENVLKAIKQLEA